MSRMRGRLKRLEKDAGEDRKVIECPTCGEVFVLYGDPVMEYLAWEWHQETGIENHGRPTDPAVLRVAEHGHDPTLMVDKADGSPWVGEFFRGSRQAFREDAEDLSE